MALPETQSELRYVRFAAFEADLSTGELRKNGVKLKFSGQPFQILAILLERPGELFSREELQNRVWPDTIVDVERNLNSAINKIREILGDVSDRPRFIETLPRRGYRFIAAVETRSQLDPPPPGRGHRRPDKTVAGIVIEPDSSPPPKQEDKAKPSQQPEKQPRPRTHAILAACGICILVSAAGWLGYKKWSAHVLVETIQHALTQMTFDDGLQTGATWSPDGRYIAYSSNRGGNSDIWIQQISGGDPIQITKGPTENWQPAWSPDGKYLAYRSEEGGGGIYITPTLGGLGQQRKIASFGYSPQWSPDSSLILFRLAFGYLEKGVYVVGLDGSPPREVLTDIGENNMAISATWHPDGKRITAWILEDWSQIPAVNPVPDFWTEPLDGGPPIKSNLPSELKKEIMSVAESTGRGAWRTDFKFVWAPSGKAIYFERSFRGARNIWRMTVDPLTLQPRSLERLTTSPGFDADLSISPDGRRLAFTDQSQQIRGWSFPFDANHGRLTGPGEPVTSAGIEAWMLNLSRDGKKLGIWGSRDGKTGSWEESLSSGREEPLVAGDSDRRTAPVWSPDGKRAAYARTHGASEERQLVVWSSDRRNEDPIGPGALTIVCDWSPDGKSLLVTRENVKTQMWEIWQLPVDPASPGASAPRMIASDPHFHLFQAHFSPGGKWIVFEEVREVFHRLNATLHVMPAAGGPWIQITDGAQWDDKPRWSPDGKTIYYLSERNGFLNLWRIGFNPLTGSLQGAPSQITSFDSPILMIPKYVPTIEFSLAPRQLVVPMAKTSGNIWILDDVDR